MTKQHFFFIANKIYPFSYVSLESALSFYGIIPEAVFSVTSVTSLKTNQFANLLGNFNYFNIKPKLFFGYQILQKDTYFYLFAELEKTILDYFYLKSYIKTLEDIKSLRFNKFVLQEKLDLQKLSEYAMLFNSNVLSNKITILKQFLDA